MLQTVYQEYKRYNLEKIRDLVGERDFIITQIGNESWLSLNAFEKQERRKTYLANILTDDKPVVFLYYENMITVYSLILSLLNKLEILVNNRKLEATEIGLLRISAMALIEKGFMDESILPKRHVGSDVFSNLTLEFDNEYPDLNLKNLSDQYSYMYRFWPGKRNIVEENSANIEKFKTIYDILYDKLKFEEGEGKVKNYSAEFSLLSIKSNKASWQMLHSFNKQDRRRETWMRSRRNPESLTGSPYYEKVILIYDHILDILTLLKGILRDDESIKNAELGQLRIWAILQIEKDNMDEDLLPKQHILPRYITNLAEEYDQTYPNLRLLDLAQAYIDMYEHWPGKPGNSSH